jgi:hypothetical protein
MVRIGNNGLEKHKMLQERIHILIKMLNNPSCQRRRIVDEISSSYDSMCGIFPPSHVERAAVGYLLAKERHRLIKENKDFCRRIEERAQEVKPNAEES